MNSSKLFAFVLIALGIMAFAYHTLLGATDGTTNFISPATVLGAVALAGGIVVLVIDRSEHAA